ncbi:PH domain-containing protein [Paenibacillus mesophilus]|uniref:PH domain-containing protein n=1 Tax=Paenibacillus mesophilus TaxID=2582849 RepID=UPI00110F16BB|nr:PH domain-containing protein [Paenibacillus mesophilus]TMV48628.1 PH domain-containing protein [Paenibacillus mesophilus]
MSAETKSMLEWTLVAECPIPQDVNALLVTGEVAVAAYKTFRDSAIFTNKRLIVRDAQGLTGKKVEIYSLPYSSINMWSTENAGGFLDFNAEVELWTRAGHIKVKLQKGIDIRKFDMLIANALLKD